MDQSWGTVLVKGSSGEQIETQDQRDRVKRRRSRSLSEAARVAVCSRTGVQQNRCAAEQVCSRTGVQDRALQAAGEVGWNDDLESLRSPKFSWQAQRES
jgi:hypothetical protein